MELNRATGSEKRRRLAEGVVLPGVAAQAVSFVDAARACITQFLNTPVTTVS
jgi:hypothetical protein